jgi:hypothetical protein
MILWLVSDDFGPPPKIEVMPPEVGEIIAWRAWRYDNGLVGSTVVDMTWTPGEVVRGVIEDDGGWDLGGWGGGFGVHGWKTQAEAHAYAAWWSARLPTFAVVLGRVALWGTVVEHERGYRAEYAKPASFDEVFAVPGGPRIGGVLDALRRTYFMPAERAPQERS